ncbi:MAG: hypothetical protein CL823_05765 [Crocinitomicaceae bacterium]|nr:hypothetical protein [Crocinitomicaceae bacterium]
MENEDSNKAPVNSENADINQHFKEVKSTENYLSLAGSETNLLSLGKWTKFFAVLNYIAIAFIILWVVYVIIVTLVIGGLAYAVSFAQQVRTLNVFLVCVIPFVILFISTNYLNRAGNGLKRAVQTGDNRSLADGIQGLKSYYALYGILTIIGFCICALFMILAILL